VKKVPYQAPGFSLPDESGNMRHLQYFKGKWLVLYFYPQDDTPGCTMQACGMRDARDELIAMGAEVVGISKDSVQSHDAFKAKYTLNFTLLSDESMATIKAYECWGKKMFGVEGVLRRTFLIDPQGIVQKVYGRVNVVGHNTKVIEDLRRLQQK
jgi:thioredoxin-dependent peroxiredoxin